MAATVTIREKNTVSETATDKTSGTFRFKKADDANVDANAPMVKPTSGNDFSFEKWSRLRIGGTGPTGAITSPTMYTDGTNSYGTGIDLYAKTTNPGSFTTPALATAITGYTDIFTYATGARKALDAVNAGPFTGTNVDIGDYLVMMMRLGTGVSAPQNPTSAETITFAWNET